MVGEDLGVLDGMAFIHDGDEDKSFVLNEATVAEGDWNRDLMEFSLLGPGRSSLASLSKSVEFLIREMAEFVREDGCKGNLVVSRAKDSRKGVLNMAKYKQLEICFGIYSAQVRGMSATIREIVNSKR